MVGHDCRKVVCIHLHKCGQAKGQAAAALTGALATAEAAAAEDHLKVALTALAILRQPMSAPAMSPALLCSVRCAVYHAVHDMLQC